MTIAEINEKLVKELEEEIDGAEKYHEMAISAKTNDREDMGVYLFAIAKDEMIHAKTIHDFLKENKVEIPKDTEDKYIKFESAHKF